MNSKKDEKKEDKIGSCRLIEKSSPVQQHSTKNKKPDPMIITFATQKGGTGKTTLAIAFANYISAISERKINVFDFDYQKSFYYKWKDDELSESPKLYEVEIIGDDDQQPFSDFETLINLKIAMRSTFLTWQGHSMQNTAICSFTVILS